MYDVIGDIHGCFTEFKQLTIKLGYYWDNDIPIHPNGRRLVLLGDLSDRGPNSLAVIDTVYKLFENSSLYYTPGNHCNKLYRYFLGRNIQQTHGLETTVAELKALPKQQFEEYKHKFIKLYESAPLYVTLDDRRLVVAHAGIKYEYIGRTDKKVATFVLYGDITGEKHRDGSPVRRDWAKQYTNKNTLIVYGHTPVSKPRIVNETINIDTGCVFGGKLTAFRYPEKETVSVPSTLPYVPEKFRAFQDE